MDDHLGRSVSGGADVNGDGADDVVIGSPGAVAKRRGVAYVIFGQEDASSIDVDALAGAGFWIDAAGGDDRAGLSVALLLDAGGDQRDDVVIGAPHADNRNRRDSGSIYIVYGKQGTEPVKLRGLSLLSGLRVDGAAPHAATGTSVAGSSDLDRDDVSDILVGAPASDSEGRENSGAAYFVMVR